MVHKPGINPNCEGSLTDNIWFQVHIDNETFCNLRQGGCQGNGSEVFIDVIDRRSFGERQDIGNLPSSGYLMLREGGVEKEAFQY